VVRGSKGAWEEEEEEEVGGWEGKVDPKAVVPAIEEETRENKITHNSLGMADLHKRTILPQQNQNGSQDMWRLKNNFKPFTS